MNAMEEEADADLKALKDKLKRLQER